MKNLTIAVLILLCSASAFSQEAPQPVKDKFMQPTISKAHEGYFKPFGRAFKWSSLVYAAGTGADILTSQGKAFYEGNSLFRSRDGSVNNGRAVLAALGIYGGTWLLERRWPKGASIIRFVVGTIRAVVAVRNLR